LPIGREGIRIIFFNAKDKITAALVGNKPKTLGFIAQDVQEAMKEERMIDYSLVQPMDENTQ